MKICFLTNNIFSLGGVQRVVSVLANYLCEFNSVDIICTEHNLEIDRKIYNLNESINIITDKSISTRTTTQRVRNKLIKMLNNKTGLYNNDILASYFIDSVYPKKLQNNLVKIINEKDYDFVIGVEGEFSLLLSNISSDINAKTIGWQHNSYDAYLNNKNKYHWNQNCVFEKMIPNLDEYIVLTEYDKDKFKKNNNINSKVIYNPKSFKSKQKSEVSKPIFLAAGRFVEQKGFDLLIESFNLFSYKNSEWKLIIIGEGKQKELIKSKVDKYNLNHRITILEPTNKIKEYFLNASALLLPSRWEGMPMIVLESLEMGVPIIAYNISAIEQIIDHGKEGFIATRYNVAEFARYMEILSENYEKRKEMSKNAINTSKEFDIETICDQWNKLFNEILEFH